MQYNVTDDGEVVLFLTLDELDRLEHSVEYAALDHEIYSALQEVRSQIVQREAGLRE